MTTLSSSVNEICSIIAVAWAMIGGRDAGCGLAAGRSSGLALE
jgi:hypothetical protein